MFVFEMLIILSDKKKNVILYNYIINLLSGVQYYLAQAYTGFLSILVTFVRNYVFEQYYSKKKKTPIVWLILIIIFLIAVQIATYDGIITLLPLITVSLYTYGIWQDDIWIFKVLHLPIYFLSIIYYLYYGILINTITNSIFLITSIIGVIKTRKRKVRKRS